MKRKRKPAKKAASKGLAGVKGAKCGFEVVRKGPGRRKYRRYVCRKPNGQFKAIAKSKRKKSRKK